jgi:hypothetical protein
MRREGSPHSLARVNRRLAAPVRPEVHPHSDAHDGAAARQPKVNVNGWLAHDSRCLLLLSSLSNLCSHTCHSLY